MKRKGGGRNDFDEDDEGLSQMLSQALSQVNLFEDQ